MAQFRVLFWNIKKNNSDELKAALSEAASKHNLDLLVLAENKKLTVDEVESSTKLKYIDQAGSEEAKQWLQFFSSEKYVELIEIENPLAGEQEVDHERAGFEDYLLNWPRIVPFIVNLKSDLRLCCCALHAPSGASAKKSRKNNFAKRAKNHLLEVFNGRQNWGSVPLVVFGDFNVDPWDETLATENGWLASMSKSLTHSKVGTTTFGEALYPFFNPSYTLLGSLNEQSSAPGSYYYHNANAEDESWHLYDQLILSPNASKLNDIQSVPCILTRIGDYELLTKSLSGLIMPDQKTFSDHLPLIFSIAY